MEDLRSHVPLKGYKGGSKLWGIERRSDTPERIVFIYEALEKLDLPEDFSIIDIACGRAVVINGLAGLFPKCKPEILDIVEYEYDWAKIRSRIKKHVMPLQDFIKTENKIYDVVMMLNSFRSWRKIDINIYNDLIVWLENHSKYFITSATELKYEQGEIRGWDYKGNLQLFKMPLLKK